MRGVEANRPVRIGLFCYIIESTYMLSFAIQITGSVYGFWTLHRRLERQYELFSKILPIFPTALTIGLLQAPAVHRSFLAYMVIANTQSVFCCAASMVLLIVILVKYINTKRQIEGWRAWYRRKWKGFRSSSRNILYPKAQQARSTTFPGNDSFEQISSSVRNESSTSSWDQKIRYSAPAIYDSWLVTRLAILTVMLSGFILASVLTHLPQKADVERDARASEPDLSPGRASSNIVGYMPGVTPSLVLFVVFGTTRTLRQTMYERFVPRGIRLGRQRQRQQQQQQGTRPSTPPLRPGGGEHSYRAIPLQSPPFARQRSGSVPGEGHRSYFAGSTTTKPGLRIDAPHVGSGTYAEKRVGTDIGSDEIGISPILEHEMYHGNWR